MVTKPVMECGKPYIGGEWLGCGLGRRLGAPDAPEAQLGQRAVSVVRGRRFEQEVQLGNLFSGGLGIGLVSRLGLGNDARVLGGLRGHAELAEFGQLARRQVLFLIQNVGHPQSAVPLGVAQLALAATHDHVGAEPERFEALVLGVVQVLGDRDARQADAAHTLREARIKGAPLRLGRGVATQDGEAREIGNAAVEIGLRALCEVLGCLDERGAVGHHGLDRFDLE